ncbi:uncharacterized protein LOC119611424 isoform X2 [Lucilia sericata]|uniref:uncharacterized protein LOC119611424 isoform X2 n=1 Tax=Lucilia sericata TaxID=13632 RepID=UPI0018A81AE4|nr:uncharacterized protein LOC119611424 isoform X2 [Lucilia sericata]
MKAVLTILLMIVSCYGYDSQQLYDQLCKESFNGFFPHPEDCHKFIRCSHGKAYVFYCPANLLWHQEIESCDYSYRTKCKFHEVKNEDHKTTVEYLKSFIEHKSKPNLTAKFYYVKSMINNYNRTVLTEETLAVNVTEAIITDFDKTSIEINENLNSSINLKENILKKRLTKATKCNKNNNRTIITKRTVAVKTTEPTLTDFSKTLRKLQKILTIH